MKLNEWLNQFKEDEGFKEMKCDTCGMTIHYDKDTVISSYKECCLNTIKAKLL